ncbi:MAG TPA: peptidase, partial [Thermodesulfobacteriota bacterium]|nr:peptidase [Thermodesulfobacteriota bacterium]
PNPYEGGSSVSHWDTIAFPNQLMEPNINADLSHFVTLPSDLTLPLLIDLGW